MSSGLVNRNYHVKTRCCHDDHAQTCRCHDDHVKIRCCHDDILVRLCNSRVPHLLCDTGCNMTYLTSLDLCPPIIGVFRNGLVMEFVPGSVFTWETMIRVKEPKFWLKIAEKMAFLHVKTSVESALNYQVDERRVIQDMLLQISEQVLSSGKVPESIQKRLPTLEQVSMFRDEIEESLRNMNAEVGFCHYDINPTNIMISPDGKEVSFLDFEFCGISFQAQDIAWFFQCCVLFVNPTFDDYPSLDQQRSFIKRYLETRFRKEAKGAPNERDMEHWFGAVEKAHLLKMLAFICIIYSMHDTSPRWDELQNMGEDIFEMSLMCWERFQKLYPEIMRSGAIN